MIDVHIHIWEVVLVLTIPWPSSIVGSERWHKSLLKIIFELCKPDSAISSFSCYLSIYPYWTYNIRWKLLWSLWKCWLNIAFRRQGDTIASNSKAVFHQIWKHPGMWGQQLWLYSATLIVYCLLSLVSDLINWWRWDGWWINVACCFVRIF